jgi:hypothetical protein
MSSPYRENPMQHVARLSEAEVKAAIRDFVLNLASEDYSQGDVNLLVKENAAKDGYEVTAEVVGPWRDES